MLTEIINALCANKHTFSQFIKDITSICFNLIAKNYVSKMRENTKITHDSSNARKIRKLTPNKDAIEF